MGSSRMPQRPFLLALSLSLSLCFFSVCPPVCLSLSIYKYSFFYVCLSVCLSVCLYSFFYVCLSVFVFLCLSISVYSFFYVCLSVFVFLCLCICLSSSFPPPTNFANLTKKTICTQNKLCEHCLLSLSL